MIPFIQHKKKGVKCVLQGSNNELLADGVAFRPGEEGLIDVESPKGLPILALGSTVKVVLHESEGDVQVWSGRVYTSSREKLRVENAALCTNAEKRKTYRVNVNNDARLTAFVRRAGSLKRVWEEMVKLRDISSGGCLIETRKDLMLKKEDPDLTLTLRITLYTSVEEVLVTVKSKLDRGGDKALYGLEFVELGQRVEQAIDMYVLKLQQDEIRRSRSVLL